MPIELGGEIFFTQRELADLGVGGVMNLWIGGTVMPRLTQTGGYYTADVVLTVTLTGN